MKTTTLYEITIETMGAYEWTGLFLRAPTINDVESAIILDIESLTGHNDTMDEEDEEQAAYHIESLQRIQRIAAEVVEDFLDKHGKKNVIVAGVTIGHITAEATKTYEAE